MGLTGFLSERCAGGSEQLQVTTTITCTSRSAQKRHSGQRVRRGGGCKLHFRPQLALILARAWPSLAVRPLESWPSQPWCLPGDVKTCNNRGVRKTNQWLPYDEVSTPGVAISNVVELIGTTTKTASNTPGVISNNGTRLRISVQRTDAVAALLVVDLLAQTVPGGGWSLVSTTGCPGPAGTTTIIAPPDSSVHAWRLVGYPQPLFGVLTARVGAIVTGS